MNSKISPVVAFASLLVGAFAAPVSGADFRPITASERALESVPGYPEAPAVVLFRNGRFTMMGALGSESYSSLRVEGRIKILSEEGTGWGEVAVPHSDFIRLVSFEGRTVLPDGREVPLPKDALFRETVTGDKSWYRTKAAFPALEPGAILDFRYELRFEVVSDLAPWYFHSDIPTLHSEIVYYIPEHVSAQPWGQATFGSKFQSSQKRTAQGTELEISLDDMAPVPDEPFSPPFEDLSSSFLVVPTAIVDGGTRFLLFEDWKSACDIADYSYREVRRRDGRTRDRGREIAKAAGKEPGARARALFAFVRDQIALVDLPGVTPKVGDSLDDMVSEQRADHAGKGLVLEAMLDAAGLGPELVWAADRHYGRIDTSVANPGWFEAVLVRIELDGQEVFLDPSDPGNGFGYLRPELEGMQAVVYSRKKPRVIRLPVRSPQANTREVTVALAVDEAGRLSGTGEMVARGHHGAHWFQDHPSSSARAEAVRDYLEESFPGFEIADPEIVEDLDTARLEAKWSLVQAEEDVLGDQATVAPSRPLGPLAQPFTLAPAQRLTPVQLRYADSDRVDLTVSWPEGWVADVVPDAVSVDNRAGLFAVALDVDEEARTLRYSRRFDTVETSFDRSQYVDLRALYAAVDESDDQELVLVRE
jgi:Domain of Unknown Function with PDB structure (DUF3857)